MRTTAFIDRMRRRQAELFTSRVAVRRSTGTAGTVVDGQWVPGGTTTVYQGPALVRRSSTDRDAQYAEAGAVIEAPYTVKLPPDTDVKVGDLIEVIASTHDQALPGADLYVVGVPLDEFQIARVVRCDEQAPSGSPV